MTDAAAPVRPASAPPAKSPVWFEVVVIAVAAVTPVIAYLNNVGFAILIAVAGVASLPLMFRPRPPLFGIGVLLCLALWAIASMQWSLFSQSVDPSSLSPEDLTGPKMLLEVALYGAFVVAACALGASAARRASLTLALGLGLLAALFLAEGLGQASLYHWIRAAAGQPTETGFAVRDVGRVGFVLALLYWPVAARLCALRIGAAPVGAFAGVLVAVAIVVGSSLLGADAPTAALAVSAIVFALVRFGGRKAVWLCLAGSVLYFAFAPLLIQAVLPTMGDALRDDDSHMSWVIRLDIWRFASERILERPFFGWGLDASRMFPAPIQLHPHNGALQLWLELGAVGVALAATFWAWLFARIARTAEHDRTMAATGAATAAVFLTIGALSFGVWQEWWLGLGALAAVACIVELKGRAATLPAQRLEPSMDEDRLAP